MKTLILCLSLFLGATTTLTLFEGDHSRSRTIGHFTKISFPEPDYVGTIVVTDLKKGEVPGGMVNIASFSAADHLSVSYQDPWSEMIIHSSDGTSLALSPPEFYIGYGESIGYEIFVPGE